MDNTYDMPTFILELLAAVPELRPDYDLMEQEYREDTKNLTKRDLDELEQIREKHKLPKRDYMKPGEILVFEQLLVPFLLELARNRQRLRRLKEIMEWIERLAESEEFRVRNFIAVSICEPLITTHQASIHLLVPFMGRKTKELCTMQFEIYQISEATKKLFGVK